MKTKEVELIERQIKELFKTKEVFCARMEFKYKDFGSKLRTVNNRISWLNEFLKPLELEVEVKPIVEQDNMKLNKDIRDVLIEFAMIVQEKQYTNSQVLIRSTYDTFRIQNIVEKLTIPAVTKSDPIQDSYCSECKEICSQGYTICDECEDRIY